MRAALVTIAAVLALVGCASGSEGDAGAAPVTSAASPAVDPQEYADQIIGAFRDTYPETGRYEGDRGEASDWAAFVEFIRELEPPEGEEMAHQRMVAAFEAYVEAEKEADTVCAESPGPGGPCYVAVRAASDQWQVALERAYEIPGLSYGTLLG